MSKSRDMKDFEIEVVDEGTIIFTFKPKGYRIYFLQILENSGEIRASFEDVPTNGVKKTIKVKFSLPEDLELSCINADKRSVQITARTKEGGDHSGK